MQGDPRRPEYFKWYELAVEQEIRLTRIYEYYIETMDASYKSTLPKQVLVYFSYNTNTLSDARRAFLYANIVSHKYGENSYYASYRDRIRHFAEKKLEEGRMDEYYAVLYQEFFEEPDTEDDATLIARKMFTNRLYCDDPKMREVIVRHPQLTEEEVYSLKKGIAYPRIYNEDAVLIFRDDKQRRYVSTVACNVQPLMDDFKMTEAVLDFDINEPGVLLHYCTREEINEDNLEIFQRLVEVEDFSIEYKNQIRKRIMDYFTAHVLEDQMDLGLKDLDFPAYAAVDKPQLLELLIQRGLYPEAMEIVKAFGAEKANQTSILKLVSRMISRNEWVSDDQLYAIALKVYQDGKYDEVILRYLMDNCQGDLDVMLSIWNSAKGFDLDTLDMEEKILSLLMLTSDYRKEGEAVLESYVKQSGKERVIGAYLTQLSYACLVKEQSLAPFTRKCLEYAWKNQWPVNRICHMALLKLLAGEKDPAEKDIDMKKQILAECMEEDLQFAFYKKLPVKLLAPYQMDDKTFVELHASPDARVTLYYTLDNGLGKEEEYRSQPLKNQYEGIFVRAFTLFYGETLRYYFTVEENGKSRKTSEKTVSLNRAEGQNGSRYQMINRILAARKLDKDKEVTDNLKQYLRQEQYVADMFHLTEEE
ncbi:MAG: hypothetical protein KBT01_06945 [Clostridiales bacterium]|nr:hypothetical protein [Candidatus Blautia equi]